MLDLVALIKTVGYLGILGIVFAESGLFIGFFLPGDSLLFTAGFLASQGFFDIKLLVFLVFIGAVLGDNFGYAFGRKIGPFIFKKEDSFIFHKDNLERARIFYEKYGGKAVILARFMPGIRTFAPILAGVGKMHYKTFIFFNIIGGLLWGMGISLTGYYLGNAIPNVDKYIIPIVGLIIFLSVLPILFNILKNAEYRQQIWKALKFKKKITGDKLVIFNWKMNPEKLEEALELAKKSDFKNSVIVPPFIFLEEAIKILKKAALGAQDLFWDAKGAFTGEISAKELKNLGVKYVIIGHSERRHKLGETDEMVAKKLKAAISNGLVAILCVGETKEEKNKGDKENVIKNQLEKGLSLLAENDIKAENLLIAYEPVWAIGTGSYEKPESALKTIKFIKAFLSDKYKLNIKVLYGGSVDSKNIYYYIQYKDIDGALVGGASLVKSEIKKIVELLK